MQSELLRPVHLYLFWAFDFIYFFLLNINSLQMSFCHFMNAYWLSVLCNLKKYNPLVTVEFCFNQEYHNTKFFE